MTKKISDDELVEVSGGAELNPRVELDDADGASGGSGADLGHNPGGGGGGGGGGGADDPTPEGGSGGGMSDFTT
jgi:hypothetical protein